MKTKELKDYKNSLYTALSRDLSEFEKNFLLVAVGLLAFSVTFIKDIVKVNEADNLMLLFISWALIAIAIGLMMFAFLSSVNSSNKLWKHVDDFLISKEKINDDDEISKEDALYIKNTSNIILHKSKSNLKIMRVIAVTSFLVGVSLFATFVSLNILDENKSGKFQEKENLHLKNSGKEIQVKIGNIEIKTLDSITIIK